MRAFCNNPNITPEFIEKNYRKGLNIEWDFLSFSNNPADKYFDLLEFNCLYLNSSISLDFIEKKSTLKFPKFLIQRKDITIDFIRRNAHFFKNSIFEDRGIFTPKFIKENENLFIKPFTKIISYSTFEKIIQKDKLKFIFFLKAKF